jgi:hypothetical protein
MTTPYPQPDPAEVVRRTETWARLHRVLEPADDAEDAVLVWLVGQLDDRSAETLARMLARAVASAYDRGHDEATS